MYCNVARPIHFIPRTIKFQKNGAEKIFTRCFHANFEKMTSMSGTSPATAIWRVDLIATVWIPGTVNRQTVACSVISYLKPPESTIFLRLEQKVKAVSFYEYILFLILTRRGQRGLASRAQA